MTEQQHPKWCDQAVWARSVLDADGVPVAVPPGRSAQPVSEGGEPLRWTSDDG